MPTLDASSPARASVGSGGNCTTGSFTAPSGAVLVATCEAEGEFANPTFSISDSGGLTWTQRAQRRRGDSGAQNGGACIYTAVTASSAARTVTLTVSGANITSYSVKVDVWTGANTSTPVGATGSGSSTTNAITPTVLTTTASSSRVIGCASSWNDGGTPTSTDAADAFAVVGDNASLAGLRAHKSADTAGSGTAVTLNFDAAGTAAVAWNWCAIELLASGGGGGGTTYTATLSGTLTSSGALVKQSRKVLAGTVASAGALVRQSRKLLAGGLTPSGAVAKQIARPGLAGSVTPTGALSKQPRLASLAGTLTSAGTLARQLGKGLSGTLTGSGALAKQVSKTFAGTLSSSGAIGVVKVLLISLGGALGSGGALGVRVGKTLGGTVSSSGTLSKQLGKTFAGSLTSSGAIVATKVALVAVGGTLAAGGTLALQVGKQLAGTLAPSGGLAKQLGLALGGTLRPAGSLLAGVNVVLRNLVWTIGRPLAKWAARSPLATWRASSPRD